MKKWLALFLSVILVSSMAMTGCGSKAEDGSSAGEETASGTGSSAEGAQHKFAFIAHNKTDQSMVFLESKFKEQAEEYGFEFVSFDARGDVQKQNSQISDCISMGCDGIFVSPLDQFALVGSLQSAKEAGVTIVCVGSDVDESGQEYRGTYCGPDDFEAGELAAQMIIDQFPDGANVVMIEGMAGDSVSMRRYDGFTQAIDGSNVNLLDSQAANWDISKAMSITEDFITKYGDDIDAIYCHWDNATVAVVEALEDHNMLDKVFVVSTDGCYAGFDLIREGKIHGTVMLDMASWVTDGVKCMYDLLDGKTVESTHMEPNIVITKENVDDYAPGW